MKNLFDRIIAADGEQWLGFTVLCMVFIVMWATTMSIVADHRIRGYYVQSSAHNSAITYIVKGEVNWGEDKRVYITPDGDKALEVLEKLRNFDK